MANLSKGGPNRPRPKRKTVKNNDGLIAAAGAGCIGFAILIKLAFLALLAWGFFELVTWVTSQ